MCICVVLEVLPLLPTLFDAFFMSQNASTSAHLLVFGFAALTFIVSLCVLLYSHANLIRFNSTTLEASTTRAVCLSSTHTHRFLRVFSFSRLVATKQNRSARGEYKGCRTTSLTWAHPTTFGRCLVTTSCCGCCRCTQAKATATRFLAPLPRQPTSWIPSPSLCTGVRKMSTQTETRKQEQQQEEHQAQEQHRNGKSARKNKKIARDFPDCSIVFYCRTAYLRPVCCSFLSFCTLSKRSRNLSTLHHISNTSRNILSLTSLFSFVFFRLTRPKQKVTQSTESTCSTQHTHHV